MNVALDDANSDMSASLVVFRYGVVGARLCITGVRMANNPIGGNTSGPSRTMELSQGCLSYVSILPSTPLAYIRVVLGGKPHTRVLRSAYPPTLLPCHTFPTIVARCHLNPVIRFHRPKKGRISRLKHKLCHPPDCRDCCICTTHTVCRCLPSRHARIHKLPSHYPKRRLALLHTHRTGLTQCITHGYHLHDYSTTSLYSHTEHSGNFGQNFFAAWLERVCCHVHRQSACGNSKLSTTSIRCHSSLCLNHQQHRRMSINITPSTKSFSNRIPRRARAIAHRPPSARRPCGRRERGRGRILGRLGVPTITNNTIYGRVCLGVTLFGLLTATRLTGSASGATFISSLALAYSHVTRISYPFLPRCAFLHPGVPVLSSRHINTLSL